MVFNTFLEEISMDQKTETIITQLKNALERQEPGTNDHQWIMGICQYRFKTSQKGVRTFFRTFIMLIILDNVDN